MTFRVRFGIPEIEELMYRLQDSERQDILSKSDTLLYKHLGKAIAFLEVNPRYPGLQSHEIDPLSRRYGLKVWQSYLQNNIPSAGRIFWVYAPDKGEITIIGIAPHPEDTKRHGYDMIQLSKLPPKKN
jgi:hypothetical protein